MSVFFNGRLIVSPATASIIDDSALDPQSPSIGNNVILIGRAAGGQPKTVLRYGSPGEAARDLASGELLDAVRTAFDPSPETGGPFTVYAIRVDNAVQAQGALKDAAGDDVINLTSSNYGARENAIQYAIDPGSYSGLRITTKRGTDYYTTDNVQRRAFSVVYTGAETDPVKLTVSNLALTIDMPAGGQEVINLVQFPTIIDLVDRLNSIADIEAGVLDSSANAPALNGLDAVDAVNINGSLVEVTANLQAVIDWINSPAQDFVTAERVIGASKPPAPCSGYMAGGSDGLTTFDDWAASFEVAQDADAQWVAPISGDPAIHALADTHADYMSNVAMKERRVVCGSDLNTTDMQAINMARALNSARTSLVHIGHYNYNPQGALTLYPPYITAALLVGAFSGVNPGTPLTNKAIKVRGLERYLRNPTDTDVLITGGVLCVEKADAGVFKVVKSITTWLNDRNFNKVEQSVGMATDYVARSMRKSLDVLRGSKASPITLQRAISIADSTLRELARPEPQGMGVIVGDTKSPAYKNIQAQIDGDALRVQFECSPALPTNYVLISIFATPYSGSASATATAS